MGTLLDESLRHCSGCFSKPLLTASSTFFTVYPFVRIPISTPTASTILLVSATTQRPFNGIALLDFQGPQCILEYCFRTQRTVLITFMVGSLTVFCKIKAMLLNCILYHGINV